MTQLRAPFPYFGGKRSVVDLVWRRFGKPKQYVEPFCGSLAMLLGAPYVASLEVAGDQNFFVANFWRALKYQPDLVWAEQDYPVSHVDLEARHRWLVDPARTAALVAALAEPEWPGDPRVAGWWVWGQCAWIGSGWCEKTEWRQVPGNQQRGTQGLGVGGGAGADASPRQRGHGIQAVGTARSRTRRTRDAGPRRSGGGGHEPETLSVEPRHGAPVGTLAVACWREGMALRVK